MSTPKPLWADRVPVAHGTARRRGGQLPGTEAGRQRPASGALHLTACSLPRGPPHLSPSSADVSRTTYTLSPSRKVSSSIVASVRCTRRPAAGLLAADAAALCSSATLPRLAALLLAVAVPLAGLVPGLVAGLAALVGGLDAACAAVAAGCAATVALRVLRAESATMLRVSRRSGPAGVPARPRLVCLRPASLCCCSLPPCPALPACKGARSSQRTMRLNWEAWGRALRAYGGTLPMPAAASSAQRRTLVTCRPR